MTNIDRVRVSLTGFPGGPGVATHYGLSGPALFPAVVALWGSLASMMPADVSVKVENTGDTIEDTTGVLSGSWSIAPETGVVGASAWQYPAPVGCALTWLTDTIIDGSRVRGRTFVVPLAGDQYQTDGSLAEAGLGDLRSFAATFAAAVAENGVVWHRPRAARAAIGTLPALSARAGGHALITASRVSDKAVVLRSRRD